MSREAWQRVQWPAVFVICLAANLWFSSVGWDHSLHELHEFRQFQTALSARAIQQDGWSLAYPTPLFGPPWSAPLEFPFYQVCTAWLSTSSGLPLERTGRLVSLAFLYLSLPACFLLMRHLHVPRPRRWLFLALIVTSPLYLYYSRAFMIESLALCAAVWFLHVYSRALETAKAGWAIGAAVVGGVAALAKVTTFAVFLFPAIALTFIQLRRTFLEAQCRRTFRVTAATGLIIAGSALGLGYAWVAYGDHIKVSNPLSAFLVSSKMGEWNYGTLALRFDLLFWQRIFHHSGAVLAPVGAVLALLLALWPATATRHRTAVLLLCYLSGPLVFSNLYFVHDYYFYATGLFLLAALMVGWNAVLDLPRVPPALKAIIIVVTFAAQLFGFHRTYFGVQARGDIAAGELPRALNRITKPDDLIVYHGFMWNPSLPYESGRKAIMVTDENGLTPAPLEEVLARIPSGSVGALVVGGPMLARLPEILALAARLSLEPVPLLSSETVQVYVANRLLSASVPRVEALRLTTFKIQAPVAANYQGISQRRYRVDDLPEPGIVAMFDPRPVTILAPFSVSDADVDVAKAFNAHAPTEITINAPAAGTLIRADFGLLPEAYSGELKTDGVDFRIELIAEDGSSTPLFARILNPAMSAADRGTQHCEIALPPEFKGGHIILRTLPGPANSIAFDWAYWLKVEIR